MVHIGSMPGALIAFVLCERIGMLWSMRQLCVLWLAGVIIVITANGTLGQVYGGRFVMGLGIGQAGIVAPTYLAEIAPRKVRGSLVCFFGISEYIGIMIGVISSWFGLVFNIIANVASTSLHGVPHCISLTPVRSSGSFHRAYRSLLPDFCFYCHSCARRVLDISARLATEERRDGRWEDYGIFLERTIWFHRRSRVSKVN